MEGLIIVIFWLFLIIVEVIGPLLVGIVLAAIKRNLWYALAGLLLCFIPDAGIGLIIMGWFAFATD